MSTRSVSYGSPEVKNADVEGASAFVETQDMFGEEGSGVDPVYQAKARILNDAFQQIGMGRYQVCSISSKMMHSEHSRRFLGLVAFIHGHWLRMVLVSSNYVGRMPCSYSSIYRDNLWPIVTSLILTPVVSEFGFDGPWLKLGQNIGLLVGAAFWGVASDVWGRQYVS